MQSSDVCALLCRCAGTDPEATQASTRRWDSHRAPRHGALRSTIHQGAQVSSHTARFGGGQLPSCLEGPESISTPVNFRLLSVTCRDARWMIITFEVPASMGYEAFRVQVPGVAGTQSLGVARMPVGSAFGG